MQTKTKTFLSILIVLLGFLLVLFSTSAEQGVSASGDATNIIRDGDAIYLSSEQPNTNISSRTGTQNETGLTRTINKWRDSVLMPDFFHANIIEFINFALRLVVVISALLVFFYLIWGAMEWITSGGDKSQIEKARSKMIASIIGLLIVSSSLAIYLLVLQFFGIGSIEELLDILKPVP